MPVSDDVKAALAVYVQQRREPGGFVTAVLENNFTEAVCRADSTNLAAIRDIAIYVINHVPAIARGSRQKVDDWLTGQDIKRAGARG